MVFPTTTFAEKDGSFTNHAGRVQRIYKAIETAPGWLSDGEIFTRLLNAIDPSDRRFDPDAMWEPIRRAHSRFAGLSLDSLGGIGAMPNGAGVQAHKRPLKRLPLHDQLTHSVLANRHLMPAKSRRGAKNNGDRSGF